MCNIVIEEKLISYLTGLECDFGFRSFGSLLGIKTGWSLIIVGVTFCI